MSYLGFNIKKIRTLKKLSQTKFAELFGLSRAAIGAYEEGRAEAKVEKIIEIANYFGVSLEQILLKKLTLNEILHYDNKKQNTQFGADYTTVGYVEYSKFNQYLKNYKNFDFVRRLPKISIPITSEKKLRAFQIRNLSSFLEGDILVCSDNIDRILSDGFYLVVTNDEIVILDTIPNKRMYNEIWTVETIISNNISKFNIIRYLEDIKQKIV